MTLEDVVKDRDQRLPAFRDSLDAAAPHRSNGRSFSPATRPPMPITSSSAPSNGRARSAISKLLAADDPVAAWRGRMLDAFGGLARKSPGLGGG